jgi:hypothetical protein
MWFPEYWSIRYFWFIGRSVGPSIGFHDRIIIRTVFTCNLIGSIADSISARDVLIRAMVEVYPSIITPVVATRRIDLIPDTAKQVLGTLCILDKIVMENQVVDRGKLGFEPDAVEGYSVLRKFVVGGEVEATPVGTIIDYVIADCVVGGELEVDTFIVAKGDIIFKNLVVMAVVKGNTAAPSRDCVVPNRSITTVPF